MSVRGVKQHLNLFHRYPNTSPQWPIYGELANLIKVHTEYHKNPHYKEVQPVIAHTHGPEKKR